MIAEETTLIRADRRKSSCMTSHTGRSSGGASVHGVDQSYPIIGITACHPDLKLERADLPSDVGVLRSSRRLKPQISHGFLAPFEGFPDASPGVLQVWENVGIHVIMGLSTGLCRIYGKTWDTGDHLSTLPYISVRCHATGHLVASLTGSTNGQYTL